MNESVVTDTDSSDLQSSKSFYAQLLDYKRSLNATHEDWYVIQSEEGVGFGVSRDKAPPTEEVSPGA